MKIRSLQVTNFRCFKSLTVEFDEQLTVLVANNGMGKTAILEALANGLGVFLSSLPNVPGRNPKETDFRVCDDGTKPPYMRIRLETTDGIAWDRTERRDRTISTLKYIPEGLGYKPIAQYARDISVFGGKFPLIAYYGTGRAVFDTPSTRRGFKNGEFLSDVYRGASDAKTNFYRFFEYFYFLEDIERREKEARRDWDYRLSRLEIIREAIARMMPGFSNPHSKLRPLRFLIEWHHDNRQQTLRIDQLSDGFRTTLAMAMDIASRLAILAALNRKNTTHEALNAEGIVLIDEIDLHLHPEWQQRILPDLMRTFPNIQFIVTTHSPQVLSTVRRENIRVIRETDDDFVAEMPPISPLARQAGDALAYVMDVNVRPPLNEILEMVHVYEHLVRSGKMSSQEGLKLKSELDAAGYEIPESELALWKFMGQQAGRIKA